MSAKPISYVPPMSEEDYLASVERIQQAMAIEPFCPSLVDVLKLLGDWRYLSNRNERLRAALEEMLESFTEPEDDNDILRRARAALGNDKAC